MGGILLFPGGKGTGLMKKRRHRKERRLFFQNIFLEVKLQA
jgi:hypothetical protein